MVPASTVSSRLVPGRKSSSIRSQKNSAAAAAALQLSARVVAAAEAEERCSFVFFSSAARSHRKELSMGTARSNAARSAPALKKPEGSGWGLLVRAL